MNEVIGANFGTRKDQFVLNAPSYEYSRTLGLAHSIELAIIERNAFDINNPYGVVMSNYYNRIKSKNPGFKLFDEVTLGYYTHNCRVILAVLAQVQRILNIFDYSNRANPSGKYALSDLSGIKYDDWSDHIADIKNQLIIWKKALDSRSMLDLPILHDTVKRFLTVYEDEDVGTEKGYLMFTLPSRTVADTNNNAYYIPSSGEIGKVKNVYVFGIPNEEGYRTTWDHARNAISTLIRDFVSDTKYDDVSGQINAFKTFDYASRYISGESKFQSVYDKSVCLQFKNAHLGSILVMGVGKMSVNHVMNNDGGILNDVIQTEDPPADFGWATGRGGFNNETLFMPIITSEKDYFSGDKLTEVLTTAPVWESKTDYFESGTPGLVATSTSPYAPIRAWVNCKAKEYIGDTTHPYAINTFEIVNVAAYRNGSAFTDAQVRTSANALYVYMADNIGCLSSFEAHPRTWVGVNNNSNAAPNDFILSSGGLPIWNVERVANVDKVSMAAYHSTNFFRNFALSDREKKIDKPKDYTKKDNKVEDKK